MRDIPKFIVSVLITGILVALFVNPIERALTPEILKLFRN